MDADKAALTVRRLLLPADDLPQSLKELIQQDDLSVTDHTLHIGYEQMSADEVIRVSLQAHSSSPSPLAWPCAVHS